MQEPMRGCRAFGSCTAARKHGNLTGEVFMTTRMHSSKSVVHIGREKDDAGVRKNAHSEEVHIERRSCQCEADEPTFHRGTVDCLPDDEGDVRISARLRWERKPGSGEFSPELAHDRGRELIQRQLKRERHDCTAIRSAVVLLGDHVLGRRFDHGALARSRRISNARPRCAWRSATGAVRRTARSGMPEGNTRPSGGTHVFPDARVQVSLGSGREWSKSTARGLPATIRLRLEGVGCRVENSAPRQGSSR
jgi:hypothetical protein